MRWYFSWNNCPINFEDWQEIPPFADIIKKDDKGANSGIKAKFKKTPKMVNILKRRGQIILFLFIILIEQKFPKKEPQLKQSMKISFLIVKFEKSLKVTLRLYSYKVQPGINKEVKANFWEPFAYF